MINSKKIFYNSQTYYAFKAFVFCLPMFITLVAIVIVIARILNSGTFAFIGVICVSLIPFLFMKKYKKIFTRRVELEVDDQAFTMREFGLKKDKLLTEYSIEWKDIDSYNCNISGTTYLNFYLKNGSKRSFSFKDDKNFDKVINEKSVFSIFFYFSSLYNLDKQQEEQITFKPGFLTTQAGLVTLYVLLLLSVFVIILHVSLYPKSSMFSIISLSIVLGLLAKRRTDKTFMNTIKNLEPRSPFE